jgi:hypothetical protein
MLIRIFLTHGIIHSQMAMIKARKEAERREALLNAREESLKQLAIDRIEVCVCVVCRVTCDA